jgi:hypothetical protein
MSLKGSGSTFWRPSCRVPAWVASLNLRDSSSSVCFFADGSGGPELGRLLPRDQFPVMRQQHLRAFAEFPGEGGGVLLEGQKV